MKKFFIYWLPVLLWMSLIFYSSAQPYEKQDLRPFLSSTFDLSWVSTFFSFVSFEYAGEEISIAALGVSGFIEFFIRKSAHFFVYFILAILFYRALDNTCKKKNKLFITSLYATIIYAATDEFHQSLTINRTPLVQDVLIDLTGGLCGLLFLTFFQNKK
ncbi:MAG TPA: VanZ family protein [Massilibacterium sp.]|nr:VanZ family protein [Massilibacterium sp.]